VAGTSSVDSTRTQGRGSSESLEPRGRRCVRENTVSTSSERRRALSSIERQPVPKPDIVDFTEPPSAPSGPPAGYTGRSATHADVLSGLRSGKRDAVDELIPLLYHELRQIAHRQLAIRAREGTLCTTALVHEAYLKLIDQSQADWRDRAHFLAVASLAMRHVLVDRAKARHALKRGGERRRITLDDAEIAVDDQPEALLQLDDAMNHLALLQPRLARVVECRFFGGLTEDEIAEALGVTVRTVQRDWVKARMLLQRALES
jgi:RNA polymerase sigma factor (TIGR02999 family)